MGEMNQYRANLVTKYLTNQLTDVETVWFEDWLNSDERNKAFVERYKNVAKIQTDLDFIAAIDLDLDWEKVSTKLQKKKKRPNGYLFYALTGLVACLLIIMSYFFAETYRVESNISVSKKASSSQPDRNPAVSGAKLILADGNEISLKGDGVDLLEHKGVVVERRGKEILYQIEEDKSRPTSYNTLIVPGGEFYNITLSDGTVVWVNAKSKLLFPEAFDTDERRVKLEGEAYFSVSKDQNRPFLVECEGVTIKVLGTSFNVNAYQQRVKTSLIEGSVQLVSARDQMFIKPGDRGDFINGRFEVYPADLKRELAWKRGEFYFKGDNIVGIMNEISRWYNIDVSFSGNLDFKKLYSGSVSRHVKLSEVLKMLSFVSKNEFRILDNRILVIGETKK